VRGCSAAARIATRGRGVGNERGVNRGVAIHVE